MDGNERGKFGTFLKNAVELLSVLSEEVEVFIGGSSDGLLMSFGSSCLIESHQKVRFHRPQILHSCRR